jgi:hypothetical protein
LLEISDPKLLASLLQDAIKRRHGTVNRAARNIGLSQPTLHHIVHGTRRFVREDTARKLQLLVPRAHRDLFEHLLYPTEAHIVLLCYERWCLERIANWLRRETRSYVGVNPRPEHVRGADGRAADVRQRDWFGLLQRVRVERYSHWAALERLLQDHGCTEQRKQVAYLRVLEPLLDARDSAFVERRWDELKDAEKTAFLNAGITRERILLNRDSDVARSRRAAGQPAASWRPPRVHAVIQRVATKTREWAGRSNRRQFRINVQDDAAALQRSRARRGLPMADD